MRRDGAEEVELLRWEEASSSVGRWGGVGCAAGLLFFGCAGAAGAVDGRDWGTLVGLPFLLLVAVAVAAVSLSKTVVRVVVATDQSGGVVTTDRHILGRRVGGDSRPFGHTRRVDVEPLQAGGRTLWRVRLVGPRSVDVVATTDEAEARALAAQLVAGLGV